MKNTKNKEQLCQKKVQSTALKAEGMQEGKPRSRGKRLCFFSALFGIILLKTNFAFAAGNGNPTAKLTALETFLSTIVTAIGVILLLYSVLQFGIAHKQNDSASKSQAVLGIVGGLIIAGAPWIVVNIL